MPAIAISLIVAVCFAPCDLTATVTVERNKDNRVLEVIWEEGSSARELEGESSKRKWQFKLYGLTISQEILARVIRADGSSAVARASVNVISPYEP